jgi:hypothetical protein
LFVGNLWGEVLHLSRLVVGGDHKAYYRADGYKKADLCMDFEYYRVVVGHKVMDFPTGHILAVAHCTY